MIPTLVTFGSIAILGATTSNVFEMIHRHDLAATMNVLTKYTLIGGAVWQGNELWMLLSTFL